MSDTTTKSGTIPPAPPLPGSGFISRSARSPTTSTQVFDQTLRLPQGGTRAPQQAPQQAPHVLNTTIDNPISATLDAYTQKDHRIHFLPIHTVGICCAFTIMLLCCVAIIGLIISCLQTSVPGVIITSISIAILAPVSLGICCVMCCLVFAGYRVED
mmetsp:Transcript_10688/g.39946  ORF Transcript_10688/g.39946 Transcript_10688/m.39946 type:complete len:157 (-) Transcript_10688:2439-2909(-)